MGVVWILWLGLAVSCCMVQGRLLRCCEKSRAAMAIQQALSTMLATEQCSHPSVVLLTDGSPWAASMGYFNLEVRWGVSVFENNGGNQNMTQPWLKWTLAEAHKMWEAVWCVTVMVVSDDPDFLAEYAESSFKTHFLKIGPVKLLALTHLPLYQFQTIHHVHKTFSLTKSLVAIICDKSADVRLSVYSMLPYSEPDAPPLLVATWTTTGGLSLTSPPQLFPQYLRFPHRPHIVVTSEQLPHQLAVMVDDPTAPGGKRLTFTGPTGNIMDIVSKQLNLRYTYMRPPDGTWGTLQSDGTWNGMLGLIIAEKAEMTPGPFFMGYARSKVLDYSSYYINSVYQILAARGRPRVDPWGFLLPLSQWVWAALMTALLAVIIVMLILPSWLPPDSNQPSRIETNIFNCVRVLFQEDIRRTTGWWWWERVALGVWMMIMVVMTQSYTGNLMSLLAVRHIDHPHQSLEDVLDHGVKIIIVENTNLLPYFRLAESGIFREIGDLLGTDQVVFKKVFELPSSMRTIVLDGTHVLFDADFNYKQMLPTEFSLTGRCDFYLSFSTYMPTPIAMVTRKNSLLIPGLNKVAEVMVESGMYRYWLFTSQPNSTTCNNLPKIISVSTVLALSNVWGMFAVLGGGFLVSLMVLVLENVVAVGRCGR